LLSIYLWGKNHEKNFISYSKNDSGSSRDIIINQRGKCRIRNQHR